MGMIEPVEIEFCHEVPVTRRMLERVPVAHLGWKPHVKSMSMATLAGHIAEIPTYVRPILTTDELVFDMAGYKPFVPSDTAALLQALDANVADALECMKGVTDQHLAAVWRMKVNGQVVFELPRMVVIRTMVLNHLVHHRGQLSVYLRLKDVPLPAIYGPSADERG